MNLLHETLSYKIIGAAMEVHRTLGPGFWEIVYCRALARELTLRQISFQREVLVPVDYKGKEIGLYRAHFVVEGKVLLELKARSDLSRTHLGQALHYLTGKDLRLAVVFNFGFSSLQFIRVIK